MIRQLRTQIRRAVPRRICIRKLRSTTRKAILLTFDDGPHPQITPAILDRLHNHGVRAMFFVVGQEVEKYPEIVRRLKDEGHWIGNHTYSHPRETLGLADYLEELQSCQASVERHVGVNPRFHRPPRGQLTFASMVAPRRCGLVTMNWSRSSEDWTFRSAVDAQSHTRRLLRHTQARDVLLFHDDCPYLPEALDKILPALRRRGFSLSPTLAQIA